MAKTIKRLYRSEKDVVLGGVCAGIAEYFEIDPVIVRIIAVILAVFAFSGLVAYLILWIIIPTRSELSKKDNLLRKPAKVSKEVKKKKK